jgi:hypothetical protein
MAVISIKNKIKSGSLLVGNGPFIPNDYESIQTVTVGSGGASSVSFSSIPSTYKHLQVRILTRSTFGANEWPIFVQLNSNGSGYAYHLLQGNGSSASAGAEWSASLMQLGDTSAASGTANSFGVFIMDILDYADTNKNKTGRTLFGYDLNGSGKVGLRSGLWANTAAVTSLSFGTGGNFAEYSSFALYGIKG